MKKTYNIYLYITQVILFVLVLVMAFYIHKDNKTVRNELIKTHTTLSKDIILLENKLKKETIKVDSLYKPNILQLSESILNIRYNLATYKSEKEQIINELYINQIKFWAGIIALITIVIVLSGLDYSIGNKVNNIIGDAINSKKDLIGSIVEEKDWEFELMSKSNIIVINPNTKDDSKNLEPVLKWFKDRKGNISNIPNISFNAPDKIKDEVDNKFIKDRFNVVLIENSDGDWNLNFDNPSNKTNIDNAIKIAAKLTEKVMLVYFGPREAGDFPNRSENYYNYFDSNYSTLISKMKSEPTDSEKTKLKDIINNNKEKVYKIIDHISFANTPSKLYPNLIDALKYMDIINPKIDA